MAHSKITWVLISVILSVLAGCAAVSPTSDSGTGVSSSSSSGGSAKGHVYMKIERDAVDIQYIEILSFSTDPVISSAALTDILSGSNFQIGLTDLHFHATFTANLKDPGGNILVAYTNVTIDVGNTNDTGVCDLNTYDYFWNIKFELAVNMITGEPEIKILGKDSYNTTLVK